MQHLGWQHLETLFAAAASFPQFSLFLFVWFPFKLK